MGRLRPKLGLPILGTQGLVTCCLILKHCRCSPMKYYGLKPYRKSQFSNKDQTILDTALWANNFKDSSKSFMGRILDCLYTFKCKPGTTRGAPLRCERPIFFRQFQIIGLSFLDYFSNYRYSIFRYIQTLIDT